MVEWKEIRELFVTRNGYTPSTKDDSFWEGGKFPWFKMEDIRDNGSVLSDSKLHITEKAIKGNGLFKANSVILSTSATIGEHALITVEHLCNQRFTNFCPNKRYEDKINMKYVYYYMFIVDEWCKQHTHQGGFASVDMEGLYKLPIPIPSLSEQTRIVGILDTFTTSIENLKQQIAERRKQYEHYRDQLLDLEGKEGVEMKTLGEICLKITDGSHFSPKSVERGYYMPSVKDMTDNGFDYTSCKQISKDDYESLINTGCKPKVNDILIAKDGSMLKYVFPVTKEEEIVVLSSIAILTPCVEVINSAYLSYYLRGEKIKEKTIREFSSKGGVPRIILKNFKKISIIFPSLQEQQRIVSILDTFEASITNLEAQLKEREKQYEYYRNKLLTFE